MSAARTARSVAALLAVAVGVAAAATAQRTGVAVRCTDADGAAVAGAVVHVFQRLGLPDGSGQYARFGPFATDDAGRAACPVGLTYDGGRFDRFVHARVPGALVGGARAMRFDPGQDEPETIEVAMVPSRTWSGTVAVPDGFVAADVRVEVLSAYVAGDGLGTPLGRLHGFAGLDDALPELFDARVAADGGFALTDLPVDARLYLVATGPGLAATQWSNVLTKSRGRIEFSLETESVLRGRIVAPDGRGVPDLLVHVRLGADGDRAFVLTSRRTRTDARGTFRCDGLPAASFHVLVEGGVEDGMDALVFVPTRCDAQPAERAEEVELPLVRAHRVRGIVVERDTDTPVEGVRITGTLDGASISGPLARSDARGQFVLLLPPGDTVLQFASVPRGFAPAERRVTVTIDEHARAQPPLRLELVRRD